MAEPKTTWTDEEIAQIRTAGEAAMRAKLAELQEAKLQPEKIDDVFSRSPGGGLGWKPPEEKK